MILIYMDRCRYVDDSTKSLPDLISLRFTNFEPDPEYLVKVLGDNRRRHILQNPHHIVHMHVTKLYIQNHTSTTLLITPASSSASRVAVL